MQKLERLVQPSESCRAVSPVPRVVALAETMLHLRLPHELKHVDGESDGRLLLGDGGVDLHVRRLLIRGLRHGVAVPAEADLRRSAQMRSRVEAEGSGGGVRAPECRLVLAASS